ncbi:MAG: HAMP domain-containing histidine kinase [Clostridiales bacterium]|jgi:signal transduction histidine kinase|nr:HAMP domain-containing histidine kinase [Clostridiales bacterium]
MNLVKLFRNRPVRRVFAILIVLTTIVLTIGILWIRGKTEETVQKMVEKDIALVGGVLLNRPASQLCILTGENDPRDYRAGLDHLKSYSYPKANPENYPYYEWLVGSRIRAFVGWVGLFFLLSCFLLLLSFSMVYRTIGQLTRTAQWIAQGQVPKLEPGAEGDEAAMQYAFTSMAQRLQFHADSLKKDKEYLKDFLSDVSHQLKTPLAALRMYNEILLSKREIAPEKQREFLEQSKEQIDRTDWLIQGLLKSARMDAGAVRMDLTDSYLIDTVQNAISPFEEEAKQRGIRLAYQVDSGILLRHDSRWVTEALGNIVKNALEHTRNGGRVQVEAQETPMTVVISVSDNGCGMESTEIPLIFERFYRRGGEVSPTNVGIGLSLARQILELNGADIYVKSVVSEGSTFVITFLKHATPTGETQSFCHS